MLWSSVNTVDFSHHIRASLFALAKKKTQMELRRHWKKRKIRMELATHQMDRQIDRCEKKLA
jgi:hypothetical protein